MLARRRRKECSRFSTQLCNSTVEALTASRGSSYLRRCVNDLDNHKSEDEDAAILGVPVVALAMFTFPIRIDFSRQIKQML